MWCVYECVCDTSRFKDAQTRAQRKSGELRRSCCRCAQCACEKGELHANRRGRDKLQANEAFARFCDLHVCLYYTAFAL